MIEILKNLGDKKTKMNKSELQDLIRNLQALMRCPSCGAHYKSEEIQFLGQVDVAWLLQLNCAACSLPVLATVMVADKPKSRKIMSDFRVDEFERFGGFSEVTADDVLEMHNFLDTFDGNFSALFA